MAEGGLMNPEFLRFMQQPSSNMDDSGFFSVQVIVKALSVWNLEIESLTSPQMKRALEDPTSQQAFICNHDSHWLTVRKLGQQWFNLNSLLKSPELISDTYLSLFLHQLQLEGYSIFVVIGTLPQYEADQVLSLVRVEPPPPVSSAGHTSTAHSSHSPGDTREQSQSSKTNDASGPVKPRRFFKRHRSPDIKGRKKEEEQDLHVAMAMSVSLEENQEQFEIDQQLHFQQLQEAEGEDPMVCDDDVVEEAALTAAICASLGHTSTTHSSHSPGDTSDQSQSASNSKTNDASGPVKPGRFFKRHRSPDIKGGKKEEEQDLQMAMAMSVSLEENQEQFEIDQQLHYQQLQEAEGEDPTFRDDDDVEEAALTAAICASLEDEQSSRAKRSAVMTPAPSYRPPHSTVEHTKEEQTTEEKKMPENEEERGGNTEGDCEEPQQAKIGEASSGPTAQPLSQEELRIRRLKYLEQWGRYRSIHSTAPPSEMGGKQSRDKSSSKRALFSVRSASMDSISTSVSLRTQQSTTNVPSHSPSMDAISKHAETNGKPTRKDVHGNMYILLETASTDCETTPVVARDEKETGSGDDQVGSVGHTGEQGSCDKTTEKRGGEKSTRRSRSVRLTTSLPAAGESMSTYAATEMAKRTHTNTNKQRLVQRVLPTRSHSSRAAEKPTSVPESREMEREVQQLLKSMLKQQQVPSRDHTDDSTPPTPTAQLPEALLQCSHKELNHLASYICHTIKDTLQSSLVDQALTAQQQQQKSQTERTTAEAPVTKQVQINEEPGSVRTAPTISDRPTGVKTSGEGSGKAAEERLHRRRRHRGPRPVSSPGVYWEDDPHVNLSDPQRSQSYRLAAHGTSPSPVNELQSQTHSNEESHYHRCDGDYSPRSTRRRPTSCRACREHSRNCHSPNAVTDSGPRRKRVGRTKDMPVDVSLDDNCPGVNMVRRRYTHHHHHNVCDNCLQSLGRESFCRPSSRQRQRRPNSPDFPGNNDLRKSPEDREVRGVGEGSGFIDLNQLRTVAQALKDSAVYVDQNIQQQYEKSQRRCFSPPKSQSFRHERRHQYRVKSKQKSVAFDDCLSVAQRDQLEEQDDTAIPSSPEKLTLLQELAYPTKSRTGRDSPATDMAVIDLNVNSPCMLQPLEREPSPHSSELYTIQDNNAPNKITHLHHHYHHIIHHGEP